MLPEEARVRVLNVLNCPHADEQCTTVEMKAAREALKYLTRRANAASTVKTPLAAPGPDAQERKWGGYWHDHPTFSPSDWKFEASEGDTRRGYWDWVESRIEGNVDDAHDIPFPDIPLHLNSKELCPEAIEYLHERLKQGDIDG